jgi:hypothetical protein
MDATLPQGIIAVVVLPVGKCRLKSSASWLRWLSSQQNLEDSGTSTMRRQPGDVLQAFQARPQGRISSNRFCHLKSGSRYVPLL